MRGELVRTLCAAVALVASLSCHSAAAKSTVEFWFYGSGLAVEVMEDLVADFETLHPDIDVNLTVVPSDATWAKWTVAAAAGAPPDASLGNPGMFAPLGDALEPLEDWVAKFPNLKRSNFLATHWDGNFYGGRQLGLPFRANAQVIFYDKQLFAQAAIVSVPRTWDELALFAAKLTVSTAEKVIRYGFSFRNTAYHNRTVNHFAERNGWQKFDAAYTRSQYTDTKLVQTVEFLNDMVQRGVAVTRGMAGVGNLAGGQVAMVNTGPWELAIQRQRNAGLEIGAFQIPKGPSGAAPYASLTGENLVMFKASRNKEATMKLLEYLVYTRNGDYCKLTGSYFPVVRQAARDKYWLDSDIWYAVLQYYDEGQKALGPNPCGVQFASDDAYEKALAAIFKQQKAVMPALEEVHALAVNDLAQPALRACTID